MVRKITYLILLLCISVQAFAQGFASDLELENRDGKTIGYRILSSTTVEVEHVSISTTGLLDIPQTVANRYRVISIGDYALRNCSSITGVVIPNSVTRIGELAFYNCSGLRSITIPNSVTSIGYGAFSESGLTSITIPNSVISIESSAFSGCNITSVTIPSTVTNMGGEYGGPFGGCNSLVSIIVEQGNPVYDSRNNCNAIIETASNKLIDGCKTTTIPNSVISIGNYAFSGCSEMTTVTIPNSVIGIGRYAFASCSGLTNIPIPNSVTSIGKGAFYKCSGLTSITIPDGVISIEDYTFSNCSSLTSVSIPNSVTSIGVQSFKECSSLTSVTIPNSVTRINLGAFSDCVNISKIRMKCTTPPSIVSNTFIGVPINASVKVPCGTLQSYLNDQYWSNFTNIDESCIEVTTSVNDITMGEVSGEGIYFEDDIVCLIATAFPGNHFVKWSNGSTDNPLVFVADSNINLMATFASGEVGIEEVSVTYKVDSKNGSISINGIDNQMISIFDISGRVIIREKAENGKQYSMPHNGVYMVQIDNHPAQKVVVIRQLHM